MKFILITPLQKYGLAKNIKTSSSIEYFWAMMKLRAKRILALRSIKLNSNIKKRTSTLSFPMDTEALFLTIDIPRPLILI